MEPKKTTIEESLAIAAADIEKRKNEDAAQNAADTSARLAATANNNDFSKRLQTAIRTAIAPRLKEAEAGLGKLRINVTPNYDEVQIQVLGSSYNHVASIRFSYPPVESIDVDSGKKQPQTRDVYIMFSVIAHLDKIQLYWSPSFMKEPLAMRQSWDISAVTGDAINYTIGQVITDAITWKSAP